jgi:hypothetical protein
MADARTAKVMKVIEEKVVEEPAQLVTTTSVTSPVPDKRYRR